MKELEYEQKIAVMRILLDVVLADNKIDERENEFYERICEHIYLDESSHDDVRNLNSLLALRIISDFTPLQKQAFAKLMGQMIVADENIHYNEVRIYNEVRDFCHLEQNFDEDDYPFASKTDL